jgi:hypothetical protein
MALSDSMGLAKEGIERPCDKSAKNNKIATRPVFRIAARLQRRNWGGDEREEDR